jgi:putative transposase
LQPAADIAGDLFDNWFDPLEAEVRARSREFIEELLRAELDAALSRPRYGRSPASGSEGRARVAGHRHGSRTRSLIVSERITRVTRYWHARGKFEPLPRDR